MEGLQKLYHTCSGKPITNWSISPHKSLGKPITIWSISHKSPYPVNLSLFSLYHHTKVLVNLSALRKSQTPDKIVSLQLNSLISQTKCMLWVLKRTVSMIGLL